MTARTTPADAAELLTTYGRDVYAALAAYLARHNPPEAMARLTYDARRRCAVEQSPDGSAYRLAVALKPGAEPLAVLDATRGRRIGRRAE